MEQKKLKNKKNFLYFNLINFFIKKGKITLSKSTITKTFLILSKKYALPINLLLLKIFYRLNSYIESKKIKIKRRSYMIPFPIGLKRRIYLILKWIKLALKENKRKISLSEKLIFEFSQILSFSQNSYCFKLKMLNNKQAFSNRSNIHYRW